MNPFKLKTAYIFSVIIAALAAVASAGGILSASLYRDNRWAASQFVGNDAVTLLVAVPLLALSLWQAWRGSARGQLVWLGVLHFMLYNYAFYLFGAAFNVFFLVYVTIFALTILTLVYALPNVQAETIRQCFQAGTPVRWVGGYLLLLGVCLGGLWILLSVLFVLTGQVPQAVVDSGHPTSVVFAVDLTMLVPFALLSGLWLWRRLSWGYVLGTMMTISGGVYTLALAGMGLAADKSVVADAGALTVLWLVLSVISFAAAGLMLGNLGPVVPRSDGQSVSESAVFPAQ